MATINATATISSDIASYPITINGAMTMTKSANPSVGLEETTGLGLKATYLEQSKKCSNLFLLDALQLLSDVDFRYKSSKNQRLLVEICLMQLSSIHSMDEKKN